MTSKEIRDQYILTVGIECHVQLKTRTKLFAAVDNDAREAPANTLVSHICFGLPGALPVLNEEAVHLASRAAFALGTVPQKFSKFDRKHYFYPDLPLGYQITQFAEPIVLGGSVTVNVDGAKKEVGITRAHIEADAGKSTHPTGKDYSLVDLNRAGTPLLEIVSEPDMHTAAEAKAYVRELYLRMKYADVSDCNLYYGNMRFDVNVSVSKDSTKLGTRSETKNLNSFRAVEKAIEFETARQIGLLEKGEQILQETRGWNDAKQKTFSQRTKEDAHDYRYFPDPDLPPVVLDDAYIAKVHDEMPTMPDVWRERLGALGLDAAQIETILEAQVESSEVEYLALIENTSHDQVFTKQLLNWFVNIEIPLRRNGEVANKADNNKRLAFYAEIHRLVQMNKMNSSSAKTFIGDVLAASDYPKDVAAHAEEQGFIQVSDEGEINKIVATVLADNPQAVNDVKAGEMKAIGFIVGQVMKASKGKANPSLAQEFIKKQLNL